MARRIKLQKDGALYHIMTRTAQQVHWLKDPAVKEMLADHLGQLTDVFYCSVLTHTFLGNHYHLLLRVDRPEFDLEDIKRRFELAESRKVNPRRFHDHMAEYLYNRYTDLSDFMYYFNRGTAVAYNKQAGTNGHLWGGRFKNVVVEEGDAELAVATYIEMNAVRAGIVDDPTEYPHSSVGELKQKLEAGKEPEAPQLSVLEHLPKEIQTRTYVDWMRYVALTLQDPDLKRASLPKQFTAQGWVVDMKALHEALETRAPANWSRPVYGSDAFTRKTLEAVGWLIPIHRREAPPPGASIAVA
ncbi:MAG: transposase [Acidobacteriota bacterium]|nr:transposase [Acidobacteriota bacterium]